MIILYIGILVVLFLLIGIAHYIHAKRTANKYIESYRHFVKLLK